MSFANGTTVEIPAGLTAFQPHYDEADHPQTHNADSQTIKLKHASVLPDSSKTSSITSSITADISFTSGIVFSEGAFWQTYANGTLLILESQVPKIRPLPWLLLTLGLHTRSLGRGLFGLVLNQPFRQDGPSSMVWRIHSPCRDQDDKSCVQHAKISNQQTNFRGYRVLVPLDLELLS